ncbi:MAG: hypothetical protein L3J07_02120 [Candidatus Magasanikbacteria bacterium]|nr:hypothetical protein [Candidatus Magasanikbacteria bacterium]
MGENREGNFVPQEDREKFTQKEEEKKRFEQEELEDNLDKEYAEQFRKHKAKKILAGILGLVAVGGAMWAGIDRGSGEDQDSGQSEAKENGNLDRYNEYVGKLEGKLNDIKQLVNMEEGLSSFEKKIALNTAMTEFLLDDTNLKELDEMIDLGVDGGDHRILASKLYRVLSKSRAQDFFYDRLIEKGKYKDFINPENSMEKSSIYGGLQEHHFETLAKNFLPKSGEISKEEIDPRLFAKDVKSIAFGIKHNPEWSAQEKTAKFKQVLDGDEVRAVLQSEEFDLDLAQSYSLIKISIDTKKSGDERSNAEIIKELAEKQEIFSNIKILSEDTKNLIFVAGHDKRFGDDISREAPRYQKMGEDFGVKNIIGFSKAEGMEEVFKKSIAESKGSTTIFIDAHSSKDFFQLNNKEIITAKEFAKVLLERVKAKESLEDMTIILGGCDTYGLAENILAELKKQSEKRRFKKFEFPNIITSVEGFASVDQGVFRDSFSEAVSSKSLQKEKSLTIGDIINITAPKAYGKGSDISIFIGKKSGSEVVAEAEFGSEYSVV